MKKKNIKRSKRGRWRDFSVSQSAVIENHYKVKSKLCAFY